MPVQEKLQETDGVESPVIRVGIIELGPDEAIELLNRVRGLSGEARRLLREIAGLPRD